MVGFGPFLKQLEAAQTDPAVQTVLQRLEDQNEDGNLTPLINDIRSDPKLTLNQLFQKAVNSRDKNDPLSEILNERNPSIDHLEWLTHNNPNGQFDQILAEFPNKDKTRLTDLIAFAQKREHSETLKPLTDRLNLQSLKPIRQFVQQSMSGPQHQSIRRFLDSNPKATLSDLVTFAQRNNTSDRLTPLINHIDRSGQDGLASRILQTISQRNIASRNSPLIDSITSNGLTKATDIYQSIAQQSPADALTLLNSPESQTIDSFTDSLDPSNPITQDILHKLKDTKSPHITDLISILRSLNSPSASRPFDLLNVFANQVDFMNRNNQTDNFTDVLDHLSTLDNPKLHHLLDFLTSNNQTGRFTPLLSKIDTEFNQNRLRAFLSSHPHLSHLSQLLTQTDGISIGQFLDQLNSQNSTGQFDDVISVIDGQNLPKSVGQLIQFMQNNNENGKFSQILQKSSQIESPTLTQIVGEVMSLNSNHQLDDLIDHLNGVNRGNLESPIRFMRNNNQTGRFNTFLEKADGPHPFGLVDLIDSLAKPPQQRSAF